jgi:hypothetical protein
LSSSLLHAPSPSSPYGAAYAVLGHLSGLRNSTVPQVVLKCADTSGYSRFKIVRQDELTRHSAVHAASPWRSRSVQTYPSNMYFSNWTIARRIRQSPEREVRLIFNGSCRDVTYGVESLYALDGLPLQAVRSNCDGGTRVLVRAHSAGWHPGSRTTSRAAKRGDHRAVGSPHGALRAPTPAELASTAYASGRASTAGRVHVVGSP